MPSEMEMQATVFLLFVALVAAGLIAIWYFNLYQPLYFLLVVLFALILLYTQSSKFFAILQEYERAVVFRFGKFLKVAGPGWLILVPFVDSFVRVDLRVQTLEIHPQPIVTTGNVRLMVDAILYLHVSDSRKAIINVEDYKIASVSFIQANLRDVMGKMTLEEVISNIDRVNIILQRNLAKTAFNWGVEVDKIEIQSVEIPEEVLSAMHERRAAVEKKRAQEQRAEAQKITITALEEAGSKLTNPTLHYMYLQALHKIAEGKSTKIIFPLELSRLAENLSSRMNVPYSQAQEKIVEKYQELAKEGEKPHSIIEELKRELGYKEEKPVKKKRPDFD